MPLVIPEAASPEIFDSAGEASYPESRGHNALSKLPWIPDRKVCIENLRFSCAPNVRNDARLKV
jgi:hypothetical protein